MEWRPQSPNLNSIENLWSILDRQLMYRDPNNEDELFEMLKEGWQNIELDTLQNLVQSMPRRCQAVIDNNGLPTKY